MCLVHYKGRGKEIGGGQDASWESNGIDRGL